MRGIGRLERELRTSRQMFRASFHAAAIGKAIISVAGLCIEVNTSFATMLGYRTGEMVGMHFSDFTHPHDIAADLHLFEGVMRGERDSYQMEKRYLCRDGAVLHVLLSATVVREEDGTPIQFISEIVDLSERRRVGLELQEANAKLRELVVRDHLTGLYNRRGFEEMLATPIGPAPVSLLLIDLDNFKRINDGLGHTAGDLVLCEVGKRLPLQVRDGDHVARVGGDEFGVILFDADHAEAEAVAERIVTELGSAFQLTGLQAFVGASVGVSCSGGRAATLREMMTQADQALYAAKGAGRGRWCFAT
ncbi:GGDEF domain-containing protein [Sphingomonas sp. ERG5]|uniref:GGDEF domain-containing protein n=1 Tax=Sphingomonas sp. ERG5 TaxID=1381597 RepID=UPI001F27DCCD|nr:GGDEF domain-containing protein [Sphingomonas sp. ERG5]